MKVTFHLHLLSSFLQKGKRAINTFRGKLLKHFGVTKNGFVVWRGPSPETGEPLVAIVTGVRKASANGKTGWMHQLWILRADIPPHEAFQRGLDAATCGDCIHSGHRLGTCYVRTSEAPLAVWRAYHRGSYPVLGTDEAAELLTELHQPIRLGAYGDPAMVPFEIVEALALASPGWTGYTHQFRKPWFDKRFLTLTMVSLEGNGQTLPTGARSFRVVGSVADVRKGEILCPASDEAGQKSSCAKCKLCAGSLRRAKPVAIVGHGKATKKLLRYLEVVA